MEYEFENFAEDNQELNTQIDNKDKIRNTIINQLFEENKNTSATKNKSNINFTKLQIDLLNILKQYGFKINDKNVQLSLSSFLSNLSRII
jgi:hypothetical protein